MLTTTSFPRIKLASLAVYAAAAMVCTTTFAKPVSPDAAVTAVRGALKSDPTPMGAKMASAIRSVDAAADAAGVTNYYVVNLEPDGFVVVAGDDRVEPIIAIAPGGAFNAAGHDCLTDLVKADVPGRVAMVRAATTNTPEMQTAGAKWKQLQRYEQMPAGEKGLSSISDVRVAPFVQSRWNQSTIGSVAVYNYYTPPGSAGNATNYPCGCVATAMAQLMRYHQHPTASVGTASFSISVDGSGTSRNLRGGNGSGGPYAWGSMPFVPSSPSLAERQAIGALTVDAGVSVNMDYDSDVSGADTLKARDAFVDTFGYSSAIKGFNSRNNIGAALNTMVQPNLHARYPVLLGIVGNPGGHAIVCDGYGYNSSTLYHHLNLGWSGSSDAWYNLPLIDSSNGTFTNVYKCVYNVYVTGTGEIIAGRVIDVGERPLANALVQAFRGSGGYYTATTDENGVYALPKVPSASTYTLVVTKSGYQAASSTIATGVSAGDSTTCGNVSGADFTLALVPPPSTTILTETFEGAFPEDNGWSVGDSNASGTDAYWNDVHTTFGTGGAHGGSWKGYCAGVGYAGAATAPTYQNYMDAYMSKTLNLCGLSTATLKFWTIVPGIESCCDRYLVWMDNNLIWSNAVAIPTWAEVTLDLSAYVGGSHTLKFEFHSDVSVVYEGWYLDDITVSGVQGVANDCCASAIALTGGTPYTMTNHTATGVGDPEPPCQFSSYRGVWFTYTPSANGPVLVTTCGSTFDSILTIYSGTCGALSYVACADDNGPDCTGSRASVTFWGSSGTTYYILASSWNGQTGTLQIQAQTANDYCPGAIPLSPGVAYFQDTSDATTSGDPAPSCQNNVAKGVWFTFTPPTSGVVTISTCGSSYDTVVQAFTGACSALTPVARGCNDDGYQCAGLSSYVEFNGTAGTTYRILVEGFAAYYGTLAIVADVRAPFNLNVTSSGSTPTLLLYPSDLSGNGDGIPPFTRSYASNTLVTLTAPSEDGGSPFLKWQLDGVDFSSSVNASLTLNANHTLTAIFAPPNDQCANAIPLTDGAAYTQSTTTATSSGDPTPECVPNAGNGVWFTYTPASSGVVVVDACASSYDTVLQAYTGACGALTPVANGCNDDATCGTRSRLTFLGTAGTTYRILAAGYHNDTGTLSLTAWVSTPRTLSVASLPFSGVQVDVSQPDATGSLGGATPLTRTYADGTAVQLAAPATDGPGAFLRWQRGGTPYSSSRTINLVLSSDHAMTAVYAVPNDNCAGAITLTNGFPFAMNTLTATDAGDPPAPCAPIRRGVWFKFTPAIDELVLVSSCGSSFDSTMQVFTGDCGALQRVAYGCNDDGGPGCSSSTASVVFSGLAGTNYYILVGAYGDGGGNLSVTATSVLHNDLCGGALPLYYGVPLMMSTFNATTSSNDVPVCQPNFGKSVWFVFRSPVTGPVPISTCGSSFDTVLQVYTGSCGALSSVTCSDDNGPLCAGVNASLILNATAYETYYIMAGGWNSGSGKLRIVAGTPPIIVPVRGENLVQLDYPSYYGATYVLQQYTNDVNAGGNWVDLIQRQYFPPVTWPTNPATYFRLVTP